MADEADLQESGGKKSAQILGEMLRSQLDDIRSRLDRLEEAVFDDDK